MDRVTRACLGHRGVGPGVATLLLACIAASPAQANDPRKPPLQFAFHVDVLKGEAAEDEKDSGPDEAPMALNLVGVPLTIGTRQASFADGPGLAAGIYADYEASLSDGIAFTAQAALAKTKYLREGWGSDEARVSTAWSYRGDDVELTLEPSWRVTMIETEVTGSDYSASLRLKNNLGNGLSIVNVLHYDLYDTLAQNGDRSEAGASSGLSYRFARQASINLNFDALYTLSREGGRQVSNVSDLRDVASNIGPAISMAFPLSDEIEFAAAYRFCRESDELPRFGDERDVEDSQRFDVAATWRNLDPHVRNFNVTAAYAFDRLDSSVEGADASNHAVTLALAVNF